MNPDQTAPKGAVLCASMIKVVWFAFEYIYWSHENQVNFSVKMYWQDKVLSVDINPFPH